MNWFFLGLSRIGVLGLVWVAIALVLTILWRRPRIFIATAAAVYASDLSASLIKIVVHRHRPFEHQIGPSIPSTCSPR